MYFQRTKSVMMVSALGALMIMGQGCGGTSYRDTQTKVSSKNYGNPVTTDGSSNTTDDSDATGGTRTGVPPVDVAINAVGYTSVSLSVRTNKILRVKFKPGVQTGKRSDDSSSPQYSGLGVYLTVGSYTKPTPLLNNGYFNGSAQSSGVIDLSAGFTKTCSSTDTTCRQTVTVTVEKPNYDYYCLNHGIYCPWTRVRDGDPWNGTLTIETDDTDPLI